MNVQIKMKDVSDNNKGVIWLAKAEDVVINELQGFKGVSGWFSNEKGEHKGERIYLRNIWIESVEFLA